MVGPDQQRSARHGAVRDVVAEDERRAAGDLAARFEDVQIGVEGDLAQGDDYLQVGQQFQFTLEVGPAVAQLIGRGLVVRAERNERKP